MFKEIHNQLLKKAKELESKIKGTNHREGDTGKGRKG